MSDIKVSDFRPAPSEGFARRMVGHLMEMIASQAAPATADVGFEDRGGVPYARQAGTIRDMYVVTGRTPGVGESLTVDLQRSTDDGATWSAGLFTAPFTIDATSAAAGLVRKPINILGSLPAGSRSVAAGDRYRAVLVYVAGGGPAMTETYAVIEIS